MSDIAIAIYAQTAVWIVGTWWLERNYRRRHEDFMRIHRPTEASVIGG